MNSLFESTDRQRNRTGTRSLGLATWLYVCSTDGSLIPTDRGQAADASTASPGRIAPRRRTGSR